MSGWIEKLRRVSNSGSKQGRSVVVLLSTDVREREGRVCMPNTMEQAALRRKEEKRQFCNDVLFTKEMTEEDVKRKLLSHFAYLEDQSFYCASAVDGRTRLDFHGERRVWDGRFINRTIRGNSALYILTEMKADDLSGALQKLSNEQASHSAGEASLAYIGHSTSLQMPTSSQIPESTLHSNQKRAPVKRKNDQGAEQGFLMVQPVVSPPVKHKKGNYYLVHVPANGQALNQMLPQNQLAKVTAAPNNRSATQTVQLPSNSATQTSMQRTVSPGQLPLQMHLHLQQNQSPAGLAQGQHQFVAPQGNPSSATGGSSQQVLVHREGGDLSKMPPGGSSVLGQIDSGCESSKDDCTDYESCESEESSVHPSAEMTPDWAFTREKKKFTVSFSDELPHDAISYKADFEGLEVADLTRKNPYTLIGHNPISQIQREVKVRIMIQTANDGFTSFREDLKFTYKDKMSELLKEVLASEKNRNAALEGLCKGLQSASSGSDDLNVFRLPEAGTSTKSDSDELKSVKLLTMLIYKAAQINSLEFVDVIFSTSVGKVVFSHYKNNPTLPEDVARANGHTILGNYLENVSKSLSKERIEDKSDTVNWLELEQALDKKQDQLSTPGTDDVQPPNYSESDEKQRDYDGDDEASNVSSPFSEATDPGCEDEDPAASNQAKAETQRDQKEEEGKGIESLFTDDGDVAKYMEPPSQTEESMKIFRLAKTSWIDCEDLNKVQGHYAKEETASASEKIPSVLSNLKLSIQAGEPTVLTHSPRRGEPTEVTDHGSYKSILVSSPLTLESDHIMEDATHENSVSAPRLNFTFPKLMDLPNEYTEWNDIKLPIDILLLVCDDNEFLACFFYLEKPSKTYHRDIGHAYFGFMGNGNKNKLKITVMKCSQGCAGPGGNYTYVTSAVRVLRPKAVFLVGACSGLDCKKTKLGDVVVSSKVITNTHQISASRHMRNFMRHVADGWNPPLKDSIEQEVMVHCGGDVLCRSEAVSEDVALKHPELIAVEIEGEDVYSAIHDLQVEWIFVKGVKDHINGDQSSRDNWGVFGSVMAASVVANILHDPVIFKEWCHSGEGKRISSLSQTLRKDDMGVSSVRRIAKLPETPWSNPRTSHSAESSVKEGICWLSYLKSTILLWIIVLWQLFCGKYHRPVEGGEFSGVPQQESVPKQAETVSETPQQEHIPKQPANVMAPSQESEDDLDYKAESGYVLVINNFIFPKRSDVARVGSAEDVKNLRSLFDDFNFKTRIEENLTQSQMVETLSETAEKDLNRYDCFVCVILTHGSKDGVYGTDDAVIRIEAITSYFRRDACPSLEGKPKIFLIQACRGSQQDRVPIESDSFPVPCASSSLPADADFLICFSSAPGHESYRHPEHGTWFISTVVETFKKYAEREDLLKMMLRVNYSVANYFSKSGLKQIPCQVSMLRRKVYFNPKYKPSLATNEGFAD
ncbi:uncharacterized protein LOC111325054 isoform X3 [Stylophora pistillata]|uniref:uncharacterized protein LOC111325054 isoform X3 n=1 Tax=Stylophora pistillata TaxID=50429 RepID=UPI000C03EB9C|nr:uncharacterized protein LOC111325054 isoform X3 [Stylophora pistillata]